MPLLTKVDDTCSPGGISRASPQCYGCHVRVTKRSWEWTAYTFERFCFTRRQRLCYNSQKL